MITNSMTFAEPPADEEPVVDPLLLDSEQIAALGTARLIQDGLRLCNTHCVTALDRYTDSDDIEVLWAEVEDAASGLKLDLEISLEEDGSLVSQCACAKLEGRSEPEDEVADAASAAGTAGLCVHAIAALFAHAQGAGGSGDDQEAGRQLADAAQAAREERMARARAEVQVTPLSDAAAQTGRGVWKAQSIQSTTHFPTQYRVHLRALDRQGNYCTCPDFATNQLGTCKHIEAVLHRIRKRRDYASISAQGPTHSYVYLDWACTEPPGIRWHAGTELSPELEQLMQDYFDAAGRFKRRLPDEFLRFADKVSERADLEVGDDALGYARRMAEDSSRAARAAEISARIRDSGGRLPGIQARLYPYQVEGVAFLAGQGRALLADDMGLGKTLQAIAAAHWLHSHDGVERILVVCPASLKRQWAREITRFTGIEAQVIQGPTSGRAVQYRQGRGFYVVNYELVMRDLSVINADLRPDLLILDEAQRIKNWRTKVANAVKQIGARYAFVLTGTPLENRLEDLYSLMQVIDPRVLGPLWRYMIDFHITDERGKVLGYRNLSELRRRLSGVMLRRDRSLVRDQLPERIVQRLDVAMSPQQWEIHDSAVASAARLAQIMQRRPLTPTENNQMLSALQQARMACDAAGLVDKVTEGSPKLDELDTLLEELCVSGGQKAVIFSQWQQMTAQVEQRVRKLGLGAVHLHGGVPTQRRGELMDRFREDPAVQVFISTDAGGVGLNLQSASVLINLDIPWNPAVLDQRIARVHRLGQNQRVQAILMIAPESYEERVFALVQGKRNLFDNVVDPEATEEVVGVSKRLAEILAEDLAETASSSEREATPPAEAVPAEEAVTEDTPPEPVEYAEAALRGAETSSAQDEDLSEAVRQRISALQTHFGARIERILARRGTDAQGIEAGLVLVLDRVDEADDAMLAEINAGVAIADIPVALIDRRTLNSLNALGSASPLASARPVAVSSAAPPPAEPPLLRRAQEHLQAARMLLEQAHVAPALNLLVEALLATAAQQAGQTRPPAASQAAVWLYGDVVPAGHLTANEAGLILRAIGLSQSTEAIPEALTQALLTETEAYVAASRAFPDAGGQ